MYKISPETREKMRKSHLGKVNSLEARLKISKANTGRKFSDEHRKRLSEWQIGRKLPDSTKRKIGLYFKGKPLKEETKVKISLSKKGKTANISEDGKERMRIAGVKRMTGRFVSLETRKKMGLANKGENNYFWKGGIYDKNKAIKNSFEYKLWRKSVFERDGYTCIWCGLRSGNGKTVYLEADHIKPFSLYPELRFAIDNGRTLCRDCHKKTNTYGSKLFSKRFYTEDNS